MGARAPAGSLPKDLTLVGSLHEEYVRCGTPGCRCAAGALHGPYVYHRWRDADGRQHKRYVPPDQRRSRGGPR